MPFDVIFLFSRFYIKKDGVIFTKSSNKDVYYCFLGMELSWKLM